jgi:patatin-like phospholipase/acyl hydrolase
MSKWGPLATRYENTRQRKILSLDGGGIRGVLTLGILLELEKQLKTQLGKDDAFRLSDYFDYIGGTSTGAIIAAGLARGMSVTELLRFYEQKGEAMFDKAFLLKRVKYFYNDGPLLNELKATFGTGDIDLKSGGFKTLLLVVTMNRSTDSPWPISNNPNAKYNEQSRPDCNLRIPLYQLVRASTAAPAYFRPETLQWDPQNPEKTFVFVDGGVTPYNNPAFLMYRMATQKPYGLNWKTGEKELLIVSVGTGSAPSPWCVRSPAGYA